MWKTITVNAKGAVASIPKGASTPATLVATTLSLQSHSAAKWT